VKTVGLSKPLLLAQYTKRGTRPSYWIYVFFGRKGKEREREREVEKGFFCVDFTRTRIT